MLLTIAYFVLGLSLLNLVRMLFFGVYSDIYDIRSSKLPKYSTKKLFSDAYNPLVTVIVPAHNEELTLKRNLESLARCDYKNIELIVVNDSSTDKTFAIARYFQRKYRARFKRIKVLNANVRGKAKALNMGLRHARGSLFMCLDADSAVTTNAISQAVQTFRDPSVGSLSANVKIFPTRGLLNTIQRIEYLMCYQMKKAETTTNIQYIVGGIGSMYRMRLIRTLGGYDTDTITEDIDLSMELIDHFDGRYSISYNPRAVVYTESVLNIPGLIVQRFRWKYGRYQVFLKRSNLFFGDRKVRNKKLSWLYLPYALFSEIAYFLEPLVIVFILYLTFAYGDSRILAASILTFLFYTVFLIYGASQSYSKQERLRLSLYAPIAYVGMYVLSFVEYIATVRGIYNLPKLIRSHRSGDVANCDWTPVARKGTASI